MFQLSPVIASETIALNQQLKTDALASDIYFGLMWLHWRVNINVPLFKSEMTQIFSVMLMRTT